MYRLLQVHALSLLFRGPNTLGPHAQAFLPLLFLFFISFFYIYIYPLQLNLYWFFLHNVFWNNYIETPVIWLFFWFVSIFFKIILYSLHPQNYTLSPLVLTGKNQQNLMTKSIIPRFIMGKNLHLPLLQKGLFLPITRGGLAVLPWTRSPISSTPRIFTWAPPCWTITIQRWGMSDNGNNRRRQVVQ